MKIYFQCDGDNRIVYGPKMLPTLVMTSSMLVTFSYVINDEKLKWTVIVYAKTTGEKVGGCFFRGGTQVDAERLMTSSFRSCASAFSVTLNGKFLMYF